MTRRVFGLFVMFAISLLLHSKSDRAKIVTARVAVPIPDPTNADATYGLIDTGEDPDIKNVWEEKIETAPAKKK